jgi:hypothetical protein
MNDNARYPNFSKKNGPDLGALVAAYGGYANITPEAWRRFSAQSIWWRRWIARGGLHDPYVTVSEEDSRKPIPMWPPPGWSAYTRWKHSKD